MSTPAATSAAPLSSRPDPARSRQWWAGLALSGGIAAMAAWLAGFPFFAHLGLSALTLAIIIGMVLGNTVYPAMAPHTASGVDFAKTRLLRLGIVLFGFRVTFQEAAAIGVEGLLIDALIIFSVYGLAITVGQRFFGLDRQSCMLIGAGAAICGAAAVMAMEPVARAQAHKVSVAVATVVVFGTLSMFLYPVLYPWLGLSEHAFGVFIGSTVHEVAQVVAAGNAVGPAAATSAIVEKMVRVMMLAPFLMLVAWRMQYLARHGRLEGESGKAKLSVPWFAVGFLAIVGINSLGLIPTAVTQMLVQTSVVLLAMAMAALGLQTHASAIRKAGATPLALAGMLFLFLIVGGYAINRIVTGLLV